LIDFHCHLDLYPKPHEVIERADKAGVYVLSVTTTPKAWPGTRRMAAGRKRIRTALGLHPQVAHDRVRELSLFELLLPETKYVGEIGLDGSPDYYVHQAVQLKVFRGLLELTRNAGGRVMSLHSRNATTAVLDELSTRADAGAPILHWFSGTSDELARATEMKCWFSVGPAMLKSKKGRDRIGKMPRNRVLTETDGPFTSDGKNPLEPVDVCGALSALSEIWRTSVPEAEAIVQENMQSLLKV
jgi:TatD DNase family protein